MHNVGKVVPKIKFGRAFHRPAQTSSRVLRDLRCLQCLGMTSLHASTIPTLNLLTQIVLIRGGEIAESFRDCGQGHNIKTPRTFPM